MKTENYRFREPIKGCELMGRLEETLQDNIGLSDLQIEPTNPASRRLRIRFSENIFVEMMLNRARYYSELPYTICVPNNLPDNLSSDVYKFFKQEMERTIGYIDVSQGLRNFTKQVRFALESSVFEISELNDELQEEVNSCPINNDKLPLYLRLKFKLMNALRYFR